MTKNQFLTDSEEYLGRLRPNTAESTYKEKRRKLTCICKVMYNLYQEKKISTSNPKKLKAEDISTYVAYRRNFVADTTIHKDLGLIAGLLDYVGNNAMRVYRSTCGNSKPRNYLGRYEPLPDRTIERVFELARSTDRWNILQGCVAVILSCSAGLRPQESRKLYASDVNLKSDPPTIRVMHVKGEGSWGKPRTVIVNDGVVDILDKYMKMREVRVKLTCPGSDAMFPPLRGDDEFITQQSMCRFKEYVTRILKKEGYPDFALRDGRRAYGQRMLDRGVPIELVSHCMGHQSVETTQKFYADYDDRSVIMQVAAYNRGTAVQGGL